MTSLIIFQFFSFLRKCKGEQSTNGCETVSACLYLNYPCANASNFVCEQFTLLRQNWFSQGRRNPTSKISQGMKKKHRVCFVILFYLKKNGAHNQSDLFNWIKQKESTAEPCAFVIRRQLASITCRFRLLFDMQTAFWPDSCPSLAACVECGAQLTTQDVSIIIGGDNNDDELYVLCA